MRKLIPFGKREHENVSCEFFCGAPGNESETEVSCMRSRQSFLYVKIQMCVFSFVSFFCKIYFLDCSTFSVYIMGDKCHL